MDTAIAAANVLPYEQRLHDDWSWSMDEADRHLGRRGEVFETMRTIARRLEGLGIPYAVAGSASLFAHGAHHLAANLDLLVTCEGLAAIHERLEGQGYVPPFTGSRSLRDTESGVPIKFLVAGEFPGDGKPKPVAFPDPARVGVEIEGIRFLSLPSLVELKLASGMTNPGRLKDLADIVELIKARGLPVEFAEELNPYVREKYLELWRGLQEPLDGPEQS